VPKTGFVSYPDVVISGPDEQFEHSCLVNPVAVIEVVSEATRQYKQGLKFSHYRTLESLRNCVFIWDSSPQFLAFERTSTMWWHMVDANEAIPIPALGVSLPLSEVYRGITLPPPRPEVVGEEADIINGNNPS
jgi:Uma2 family endonuclease